MGEVRVYGKTRAGLKDKPSYWTDIEKWATARKKKTGKDVVRVNATSNSAEEWSRELSPMVLGPVDTYDGRKAISVEIAWQYSRVYTHRLLEDGKTLVHTGLAHPDGSPTGKWFGWRSAAWSNSSFKFGSPDFKANKDVIRRAFPKGSPSGFYWDGYMLDRITARREIYARLYVKYVVKTAAWAKLQALHNVGDVMIFDYDGYDDIALGKTPEETLLDTNHPWGHGLLLGFMLRGIDPLDLGPKSVKTKVVDHYQSHPLPADAILLRKSSDWSGWMNNMNNRFPITDELHGAEVTFLSSEHWFLAHRIPTEIGTIGELLKRKSGSIAKRWLRARIKAEHLKHLPLRDAADLARMRYVLVLKLKQHPRLIPALLNTGNRLIAEDCTKRPEEKEIDSTDVDVPFWGIEIQAGNQYRGQNKLGLIWMELRAELKKNGFVEAMSPEGDKIRAETGEGTFVDPELREPGLTASEEKDLERCEKAIHEGRHAVESGFRTMVVAMHNVAEKKLYRVNGQTFAEYFLNRWKMERAHAYRLVECGRQLLALGKHPVVGNFTNQAFFRPLIAVSSNEIVEASIQKIEGWQKLWPETQISPQLVESAVDLTRPLEVPKPEPRRIDSREALRLIGEARASIKNKVSPSAALDKMEKAIQELGSPRTTSINWAKKTWNPLVGCQKVGEGCKYCYAAKTLGMRLKGIYPGLVDFDSTRKDQSPFNFTGKLYLALEALNEPLLVPVGCRYFVNSLSDLFYKEVPEWFVDAVFDVMEKATWHQFQVLTKRVDRMADYTAKRYATKPAPSHIWLGASIENQAAHDLRMPQLKRVKTAVRWVSCEPCLGLIKFDLKDIHWLVLGGESGSRRKMEKPWVTSVRDQCRKAKVPFFFKQWGYCGEDGKKSPIVRYKEGEKPKEKPAATVDGESHKDFPAA